MAVGFPARVLKQREEFATPLAPDAQFAAVRNMLDEFAEHLAAYAGISAERTEQGDRVRWVLSQPGSDPSSLELATAESATSDAEMSVLLGPLAEETQRRWDAEKRVWFSIGSHRCAAHLDDLGEELRDFFQRWGIYFERK